MSQVPIKLKNKRRPMAEINVVPYVDVTLVLLIIFMVTAPIVQQSVTVALPQAPQVVDQKEQKLEDETKPFVITVTKEGMYTTSEQPEIILSNKDLESLVAEVMARSQLNPNKMIYIQGDRAAPYGKVVRIFVLLKSNGVEQVALLTEPEEVTR